VTVSACFVSRTGRVRSSNEDSILLNDLLIAEIDMPAARCTELTDQRHIFAVADGMGGHARGEAASRAVLDVLRRLYREAGLPGQFGRAISAAKRELDAMAGADPSYLGAGTTLTGMLLEAGRAVVFNCGDSRVYSISDKSAERMTKDHSLVQEFADAGLISEDEMRRHPQKNVITSAIMADGRELTPEFSADEIEVRPGDRFLLCSDGVWESLDRAALSACFPHKDMREALLCLQDAVLRAGARDNYSAIVVEIGKA